MPWRLAPRAAPVYDLRLFHGGHDRRRTCQHAREDDWRRLLDQGLSVTGHCEIVEAIEHGVETITEQRHEGGVVCEITRKRTPAGEIRKIMRGGWHLEDWIKEPGDYRTVQWIIENTELKPRYDRFAEYEAAVGGHGSPSSPAAARGCIARR